jgi:rhodanese-related sulfurtransferase
MKVLMYEEFAALREKKGFRLIDVREEDEFEDVHVRGAECFPLTRLEQGERFPEDGRPIALICRSGRRSEFAARKLEAEGYAEMTNIEGGTLAAIQMGESEVEYGRS